MWETKEWLLKNLVAWQDFSHKAAYAVIPKSGPKATPEEVLDYLGSFASNILVESLVLFLARYMKSDGLTQEDFAKAFTPFEQQVDKVSYSLEINTIGELEKAWVYQLKFEQSLKELCFFLFNWEKEKQHNVSWSYL